MKVRMLRFGGLILTSILTLVLDGRVAAEEDPVQQWRFGPGISAVRGELGGTVLGVMEGERDGDLEYVRLLPGPEGKGGILLTREAAEAGLPRGAMTVEAWVQLESTLDWGGIVGAVRDTGAEEAGWILGYRGQRFCFGLATAETKRITYLDAKTPLVLNAWYHVAATYDGVGRQRLYVDGKLSAESGIQRGGILQPDPLFYMIGAYRDDNDDFPFTGKLAEVSVWHRALDGEEIAARFEERSGVYPGIRGEEPDRLAGAGDPGAEAWPTWMGDNERRGRTRWNLQLHPSGKPLWVFHPRRQPAPAWPGTARSDHWRKRSTAETPKSVFDWVHDVVVADGQVFFGSSADDTVRCLDARTGVLKWEFIAGGPVRLTPTVTGSKVVFGCDDGAVYGLNARDGSMMWRSRLSAAAGDRRLPGNGRIMSVLPVRTGVLARGETGYFGAGLFPKEGAWYATVDLRNGRIIDEKPVDFSPQGYIAEKNGKLVADPGRTKSKPTFGTVGVGRKPSAASLDGGLTEPLEGQHDFFSRVETPEMVILGGEKRVVAFRAGDASVVWEAEVDAAARGLALAEGQLFVSTTSGRIYAFGAERGGEEIRSDRKPARPLGEESGAMALAQGLLEKLPRSRGYALVAGVGDGALLRALAEQSQLHVVGIDTDRDRISRVRRSLAAAGVYGGVAIEEAGGGSVAVQEVDRYDVLPYVDGIFNLITYGDDGVELPRAEAERLLRPWDGVAMLGVGEEWRGEAPPGAGRWTHAYGDVNNTASSGDTLVDGEMNLRWFGRPGPEHMVDRHLRAMPPLAAGGFLLVPGRDYLFGLDAHNGVVLWEQPIARFMRASMLRDCGNLAFDPRTKRAFAASGERCLVIDVETGTRTREFSVDAGSEEWGYLAVAGDHLVGSAVVKGAVRRELSYDAIWEGGYGDGKRVVVSHRLFALDPVMGESRWEYLPQGAIANPSIGIEDGRLLFLESRNPETKNSLGRWHYPELIDAAGADWVALDLDSGKPLWRRPVTLAGREIQSLYLSASAGHLAVVFSQNTVGEGSAEKTLHYGIRVMKSSDGRLLWEHNFDTGQKVNLTHGEQDFHPVIAGNRLVVQTRVFDLASGDPLFRFKKGYGCGTLSASVNKLYYRSSLPAVFDLESREERSITTTTRPGCWINMIPANGLLLVPEGSSGCICSFPVQASMAFGAAR